MGDPEGTAGTEVVLLLGMFSLTEWRAPPKHIKRWRSQYLSPEKPKFTPNKEVERLPRPLPPTFVPRASLKP